jgi:hypothetical protein
MEPCGHGQQNKSSAGGFTWAIIFAEDRLGRKHEKAVKPTSRQCMLIVVPLEAELDPARPATKTSGQMP